LFGHDVPWLAIIKVIGLHVLVRRDFAGAKLSFLRFGFFRRRLPSTRKNDNRFNHFGSHWLGPSFWHVLRAAQFRTN
jgi:hypothetical protein